MSDDLRKLLREIRDDARYLRELKTNQNRIRKKYGSREDKARFVGHMELEQVGRANQCLDYVRRTYGWDPYDQVWINPSRAPKTDKDRLDFLAAGIWIQTARIHLNMLLWAGQEAERRSQDPILFGFETWLICRVLAPVYVIASVSTDEAIPEEIRTRAVALVSGYAEASTNLDRNKALRVAFKTLEALRPELPGTVCQAWTEILEDTRAGKDGPTFLQRIFQDVAPGSEAYRKEQQFPADPDTGAIVDAFKDPSQLDPLEVLAAKAQAAAANENVAEFLQSLTGHQQAFARLLVERPELLDATDAEIALLLGLKPHDIPNLRHRLKPKFLRFKKSS